MCKDMSAGLSTDVAEPETRPLGFTEVRSDPLARGGQGTGPCVWGGLETRDVLGTNIAGTLWIKQQPSSGD